jgi:hypothetical protein
MIKRQRHSEDFKRRIGLELASGVSRPALWGPNELQGVRHKYFNILL